MPLKKNIYSLAELFSAYSQVYSRQTSMQNITSNTMEGLAEASPALAAFVVLTVAFLCSGPGGSGHDECMWKTSSKRHRRTGIANLIYRWPYGTELLDRHSMRLCSVFVMSIFNILWNRQPTVNLHRFRT